MYISPFILYNGKAGKGPAQSIDKVDALPSKASKQSFDGNINLL